MSARARRTRGAAVALALAGLTLSGAAAGACLPEFDQPDVATGGAVGILQTAQGGRKALALARDMYAATWQRLLFASPAAPVTLTDAQVASPAALAGIRVLVLPGTGALSTAQRRTILAWVRGGGGLVALYQVGRSDPRGVSLTPPLRRRQRATALPAWGALSPAFGARVMDFGMRQATFAMAPANPVTQAAQTYCGGPLPRYTWRRGNAPVAITGELGVLGPTAQPLVRVASATVRTGGRRVPRGAVMGWTNTFGAGRVVSIGFNMMDSWRSYTFETYYSGDPTAPDTTVALLRGALQWASRAATGPAGV